MISPEKEKMKKIREKKSEGNFVQFSEKSIATTQCGNFIILLSHRFYVKSIFGILKVQNLPF